MQVVRQTRVSSEKVWQAWALAHSLYGTGKLETGAFGKMQGGRKKGLVYTVIDVVPGVKFSLLLKTFCFRLCFSHAVSPQKSGSEIRYSCSIHGIFAWPLRWALKNKIQTNLELVLKSFIQKLEYPY